MKKFLSEFFGVQKNNKESDESDSDDEEEFVFGTNEIDTEKSLRRLAPVNTAPDNDIYNTIVLVIHCTKHNKVAVCRTNHIRKTTSGVTRSQAIWLPFIHHSTTCAEPEAVHKGVALILNAKTGYFSEDSDEETDNPKLWTTFLLDITRIQLPYSHRFVQRLIYLVKLPKEKSTLQCCSKNETNSRILWITPNKMPTEVIENCWGPEVSEYIGKVGADMTDVDSYQKDTELDLIDYVYHFVGCEQPTTDEEVILNLLSIGVKQVERVFLDFFHQCYPSTHMTFASFRSYFTKFAINWNQNQMNRHYNAFQFKDNDGIDFHEFLMGIACVEPRASTCEARYKYIFRYYDFNGDGFLDSTEFTAIIKDKNPGLSDDKVNQKVSEAMKLMKATTMGVTYDGYHECILARNFRDTYALCRASKPLFDVILKLLTKKGINANPELKKVVSQCIEESMLDIDCPECPKIRYELSPHYVEIGTDGKCTDFGLLEEPISKPKLNPSADPLMSLKYATDVTFNKDCLAHILRLKIIEFNQNKGTRDEPKGLFADSDDNRKKLSEMVDELADQLIPIFESEDRCLKLDSPAVIIGDIHGNLEDLLSIEKCLFATVPVFTSNFVFLGDIVDRGKWSVECALYVLCLKLLAPKQIYLIRGNHETRVVQNRYTFEKECKSKYKSYANNIYKTLNNVFDRWPLAAVIDDDQFCAHGGIPYISTNIGQINKIPKVLKNVQKESALAWELLWNDPVHLKEFNEIISLQKISDTKRGFLANTRRATGYFFNRLATLDFLRTNGLSHVIRAHEVPIDGFRFHHNFKCLTIFSSSHYSGADNKAAVLHISDQRMQIVILDTRHNKPATDDPNDRRKNKS